VKNAGEAALSKVRVQLTLPPGKDNIANFEFSEFESGSRTSFLDAVVEPDSLVKLNKDQVESIRKIADRHHKLRTLSGIDATFDATLSSKLRSLNVPESITQPINKKEWTHDLWLQKCKQRGIDDSRCEMLETVFCDWEFSRQDFWLEAHKRWRDDTGVMVTYENNQILPTAQMYFDLPLGAKEAGIFDIRYGSTSMTPELTVASIDTNRITKVDKDDLAISTFWFNLKYYRVETIIALILVFSCAVFAWPVMRPIQFLPVFKIFNFAIKTNDDEAWDLAFKKYRYYIVVHLKELLADVNKVLPLNNEEVFDFIKYGLRGYFGKHSDKFKSNEELGQFITKQLRTLVAVWANADT